ELKKKILQAVQEETRQEVERLIARALHEQERRGRLGCRWCRKKPPGGQPRAPSKSQKYNAVKGHSF
ncbi:MAG TPA: hypothetical protein VN648_29560, partial [Candidatus Methylomirabilis sp.]|nr:hypothetical protein [Candidatus Methylomirabilis sp.]